MEIEDVIKNSETKSEVINKIFGYYNGTTQRLFEKMVTDKNYDISHLKSRKSKYKLITKKCPICGNDFTVKGNKNGVKKTCSHSCSNTFFRSGKNHPNWNENSYRSTCFEYHEKKCVVCGEKNIVSVHHYDYNHNNNNPNNLIPLCPTHHQYIHSKYINDVIGIVDDYRCEFIKNNGL